MAADERLAQYEVRRPIGKGSYGEVFLVTRRGDSKKVREPQGDSVEPEGNYWPST